MSQKLTDWLASIAQKVILPTSASQPAVPDHPLLEKVQSPGCAGCVKATDPAHLSCTAVKALGSGPPQYRLSLRYLRAMQALVQQLHESVAGLYNWNPSFQINGARIYNYPSATSWGIVQCGLGADKNEMIIQTVDGADPRRLVLAAYRKREPEYGMNWMVGGGVFGTLQPGMVIEYIWPSWLAFTSRPRIVKIVDCQPELKRVRIRLDQPCDAAVRSQTQGNETIFLRIWSYAGDLPKWPQINDPDLSGNRCVHAKRDPTNSYQATGAGNGMAVDAQGRTWYCAKRRYAVEKYVDTDNDGRADTIEYEWKRASGAPDFPADGQCCNAACDQYTHASAAGIDDRPWSTPLHLGRVLLALLGGVMTRVDQGLPGLATNMNWTVQTVGNPSLMSLTGLRALSSPPGMHEYSFFPVCGLYGTAVVDSDATGNESIRLRHGLQFDNSHPRSAVLMGPPLQAPPDGHAPREVEDWAAVRKEVDYQEDHTDASDPYRDIRTAGEALSCLIERDTGNLEKRGLARWSHAEPETGWTIVTAVFAAAPGNRQMRDAGWFEVLSTPKTLAGKTVSAALGIPGLRQAAKHADSLGQRRVDAAVSLENSRYKVEFAHGQHRWSYVLTVERGNSFDKVLTWAGGGSRPILAPEFARVDSYYETDKYLGPARTMLAPGDSIEFDALPGHLFAVEQVNPFGGAVDPSGLGSTVDNFLASGCYTPDSSVTLTGTVPTGDGRAVEVRGAMLAADWLRAVAAPAGQDWLSVYGQAALKAGFVLRNRRTGEMMLIVERAGVDVVYNGTVGMSINVNRGHGGTAPQDVMANDPIDVVMVSDANTGVRLVPVGGDFEPQTIEAGKYWFDSRQNMLRFSSADVGRALRICYSINGKAQNTKDNAIVETPWVVPGEATTVVRSLSWADWQRATSRTVEVGGQVLTQVPWGSAPPAPGAYAAQSDNGLVAVRLNIAHAGRRITIRLSMPDEVTPAPDCAIQCSDYPAFYKRRDAVIIVDTAGLLAGAPIVGSQATFWRSATALVQPVRVQACEYGGNWADIPDTQRVDDLATGIIWLTNEWLTANAGKKLCFRVLNTEN